MNPDAKQAAASEREKNQRAVLTVLVAAVILFAVGYHLGTKTQGKEDALTMHSLKSRSDALKGRLAKCADMVQGLRLDHDLKLSDGQEMQDRIRSLRKESEDLGTARDAQEKLNAECTEQADVQRSLYSKIDAENAAKIKKLEKENRRLNGITRQLSQTKGMRWRLMYHNLVRLIKENDALNRQLGNEPVPVEKKALSTYQELVYNKWKPEAKKLLDNKETLLPSEEKAMNERIASMRSRANAFAYDPKVHTEIFVPKAGERPTWNGRVGTQPVTRGTYIGRRFGSTNRLSTAIQSLLYTALCSYKRNNVNLTFPDRFRRAPDDSYGFVNYLRRPTPYNGTFRLSEVSLSTIIDTPLVTFCTDCQDMRFTTQFRLLCGVEQHEYGSYKFWAMRSLIRFQPKFYELADRVAQQLGLPDQKYTSVVWSPTRRWKRVCERYYRRVNNQSRTFKWIVSNHGESYTNYTKFLTAGEAAKDALPQCYQSKELIALVLAAYCKRSGVRALYLSSELSRSDENVVTFLRQQLPDITLVTKLDLLMTAQGESTTTLTESDADVLDIILAARASSLIGNAYHARSSVILESYLLQHNLKTEDILWI
eukprot:PhM_4_TR6731/c0_g1_i1/m.13903